ncbi:nitrite reductase large subunit NirB [Commensalibacter papalotli (ex Servin-Garciduenas et al. 2014)]|uniref:Nitrite reductase subunit NirD n=1 Tax=Commensalibacter papalotli (ex Servin-Garciduenas et al. 2014) TaxID=1208583 RepID=W7DVF9_9PROT|nr:nitrite reductase large subunit NirB [Commensalibacter papalotli (ex Servin-Garciduenas et al. 2014)]EUK18218.1 nitrite reductase subunit NirD [Commensalibacter papalotli (ex Servin-Garciduenas et al. 2014)]
MDPIKLIIIGNGMVGHKFVDELYNKADQNQFDVTIFCAEPYVAYDRVHLSSYFSDYQASSLSLVPQGFYENHHVQLLLGEQAVSIDCQKKEVYGASGCIVPYDKLVIATGSNAYVPPIPGADGKDCFVYRSLTDLDKIADCAKRSKVGAVVGGGLLGLEAAGALRKLRIETHVVEFAPILMCEQLDEMGGQLLRKKIEAMDITIHTHKNTKQIIDAEHGKIMQFADGSSIAIDFIVFATGIRPNDALAKQSQLLIGQKGGIQINEYCQTSNPDIYAIGECAVWNSQIFGLVAPGYKMAQIAIDHLLGEDTAPFVGADMSAKLKLLGVDVGSIGDAKGRTPSANSYIYLDEKQEIYKRLIVSGDNKKLLGAVLVGDTSDYGNLLQLMLNQIDLPEHPDALILPSYTGSKPIIGVESLPDSAPICSCLDVTKGQIVAAIQAGCHTVDEIKATTKAGTGCGGCIPMVTQVLNAELSKQGIEVKKQLCAHFAYTRQELYHLIKVGNIKTFQELLEKHGQGYGCEICKPTAASLFASCWNEYVLKPELVSLQDSNDNFLGNIQKDGTYSIIPRSAGGEITPDGLIAVGEIAKKYNLYSKITGSQRIALFGAKLNELPEIWKALIAAGFETGHAYAKALRMAKTCVGSEWCRFGVGDSVAFGVEIENRYKGIRTPHKMKIGVSGCTRECAEAQGKDIGLIATEKGWNLYVCGNGGMTPRHADLLAGNLDRETVVKYMDRFMMFYIRTADKLQRTAVWLQSLEGGIDYLRSVIIDDKLGINAELEKDITGLREQFKCEWKETVENPQYQKRFAHFMNSDLPDNFVQMVSERQQHRPAKPEERIFS